ncbi:heme ABC transporter permease [Abyssibacter profundi]|uniref:Heme exporter protein C n=1 Tax=Abyssibacter profundi TaxID=2182787 RepID=A0A363UPV9_9GAMM|nr:heme ABC transporter permease [Abyssibacter profundi]MBV62617.1 heme ABC transporter permease [Nevskiales bacterium]PWN57445.1 heme ABC transporter permease [Abyssibacter profundi]
MWTWFHRLASPPTFYRWGGTLQWIFGVLAVLLIVVGTYGGLVLAPADYQQGDAFRIIYVHVPSAWLSLFVYTSMAVAGGVALIWRMKLAELYVIAAAPLGAAFTALALVTGMLWGEPMWGTYWVWDARLTSELVLLFLYLGVIALAAAFEDPRRGARAAAVLALIGVVNVPIIHYSVEWWNSLHQGATVTKFDSPSITGDMLWPLLVNALGFMCYFACLQCVRMRALILSRERDARWVREAVA